MKKLLFGLLFVLLLIRPALAVETSPSPTTEPEVGAESVPDAGSFGDWWLQNITERFQLFVARTDERKVELEEKFANRREAQLQKLEDMDDSNPRKAELIQKIEDRYQKHLDNIERHAAKLTEKKQEIMDRIEEKKTQFEEVKSFVEERKEDRTQNREEFLKKLQELRSKRRSLVDEFKDDVKDGSGSARDAAHELKTGMQEVRTEVKDAVKTRKVENLELRNKYKERMLEEKKKLEEEHKQSAKPPEVKFTERVKEQVHEAKVEAQNAEHPDEVETESEHSGSGKDTTVLGLSTTEYNRVLGASDYQPVGFFEKIGWWLAGR